MLNLKEAVTIGNHDFVKLNPQDFLKLNPIPTNRNSENRVRKMKPTFDEAYAVGQESTLTEVAVGIVKKDFKDPETQYEYKAGQQYLIDGNTRQHYWKLNPDLLDKLHNGITAKLHYLSSMTDVKFAYYPYNSAKSTEKKADILQGLARRYNWQPKQTIFANGGYGTALDWATEDPTVDKKDPNRKMGVFEAFDTAFDQLKVLDSIPKHGDYTISKPALKPIKSQAILAALMIALRVHPNNLNLLGMIERLARIDTDELNKARALGDVDPVQIIALEWTGLSAYRGTNGTAMSLWLEGYAGDTKFASQEPQLNFLLYWISQYISNPNKTVKLTKGVKSDLWNDAWIDFV